MVQKWPNWGKICLDICDFDLWPLTLIFAWESLLSMGLLPDTQNCGLRMRRECRERFPRHRLPRKPLVSDFGMHHGTCMTHMPWCMSGSLTPAEAGDVSGIPGWCATWNFCVSGKRPMVIIPEKFMMIGWQEHCANGVTDGRTSTVKLTALESSSGVVVRSTGAYKWLSGHPAGPVLGRVARAEYPVPKHYTCQAVRSGFRESFSWLSIVVRMRHKIEVPPT